MRVLPPQDSAYPPPCDAPTPMSWFSSSPPSAPCSNATLSETPQAVDGGCDLRAPSGQHALISRPLASPASDPSDTKGVRRQAGDTDSRSQDRVGRGRGGWWGLRLVCSLLAQAYQCWPDCDRLDLAAGGAEHPFWGGREALWERVSGCEVPWSSPSLLGRQSKLLDARMGLAAPRWAQARGADRL